MPIVVDLDVMMARRKMRLAELAERTGITVNNLSVLKNDRARAVRFTTLEAVCVALDCQPGDLLRWAPDPVADAEGPAAPTGDTRPHDDHPQPPLATTACRTSA